MDLEKRGSRVLPALATALARPSASSSHRGTCRPRRRQRLRLPKPRCGGDCQHPCPSPSRLSGLFGVPGALDGEAYPNEKLLIAGLAVTAILVKGLTTPTHHNPKNPLGHAPNGAAAAAPPSRGRRRFAPPTLSQITQYSGASSGGCCSLGLR